MLLLADCLNLQFMTKRIVLCADDYGQAPSVSTGILNLVQQGRLSALSCLVTGSDWEVSACKLLPFKDKVAIGLHFNLTEGAPLSPRFEASYGKVLPPVSRLMLLALLRRLDQKVLEAEMEAQLDQFQAALGCLPDFIDGHQHVHQFPVVRDAVIAVYQRRYPACSVRLRLAKPILQPIDFIMDIKKTIIRLMGADAFERLLEQNQIPHNKSFSGIYHLKENSDYSKHFNVFLREIGEEGIIMCHPGLSAGNGEKEDPIAGARENEYRYFASEQFLEDCHEAGIRLTL